jgi:hypothetical protein
VESSMSHNGGTAPTPQLKGHELDAGRSRHQSLTDQPYSYRTVVGVTACVCQPYDEAAAKSATYMLRPMHRESTQLSHIESHHNRSI